MTQRVINHGSRMVLWLLLVVFTTPAWADETGKVVAVQSRRYKLKNELHGSIGVLPLDAFFKGFTVGGNYTFHFNNFVGLELFNFHLSKNFNTGLREDLQTNFGVSTTEFDLLKHIMTSGLVIKPIYGKSILFNRMLLHSETSVVVGGGVTKYDSGFKPAAGGGLIFRIWLTRAWSMRFDARDYVVFKDGGMENALHITAGLSLSFPWD